MTQHARSKPNGRNLIAQGEPLVWLTGGMFAIAITMIVALISLILYQGLATLWPRPYALFRTGDGGFVSGEWIATQPYRLTSAGLTNFSEESQTKGKELLGDQDAVNSEQLYLRTGNFDLVGHHFAYVPTVTLRNPTPEFPQEIWSVERLEWGVLYGFPISFQANFFPEMNGDYEKQANFFEQMERFRPTEEGTNEAFDGLVRQFQAHLKSQSEKLSKEYREGPAGVPSSIVVPEEIQQAVTVSYRRMAKVERELEHLKHAISLVDRKIANLRIDVRKAELHEGTDLLSELDDGLEIANSLGAVQQQWIELEASWERFKVIAATPPAASSEASKAEIARISKQIQSLREQEVAPWKSKLEEWKASHAEQLPPKSKAAVFNALSCAESAAMEQQKLNEEIGRLDRIRGSESVTFSLPILGDKTVPSDKLTDSKAMGLVRIANKEGGATAYAWRGEGTEVARPLRAHSVPVADMVRWFEPNRLSLFGKLQVYGSRWVEFLFGEPREAGVEGGFFPAIWGTIVMTLLMSIAVMPFGVMAALYMREYAKGGWILSLIRISINNLAGVPSIVYGVFGLAFFCYTVGGYIDGGPRKAGFEPWPPVTWFGACALTVLAGTGAFFLAFLGSGSPAHMSPLRKRIASFAGVFWILSLLGFIALLIKVPFFDGFYQASLPNPTFGKGCLLWASFTLALLTLPVVIVATEEALSAVPNSLREGSYACGAGKWQTLQRIVLPYARPGIITGFILSMARGAGEVAPMMLVGAIPLATELPLDGEFPFFHGSRSFMHLGFQIFSLGFQSQNSEAAKPMVFTATLLLLSIVTFLNVAAIWLRAQLRKRFQSSQF